MSQPNDRSKPRIATRSIWWDALVAVASGHWWTFHEHKLHAIDVQRIVQFNNRFILTIPQSTTSCIMPVLLMNCHISNTPFLIIICSLLLLFQLPEAVRGKVNSSVWAKRHQEKRYHCGRCGCTANYTRTCTRPICWMDHSQTDWVIDIPFYLWWLSWYYTINDYRYFI